MTAIAWPKLMRLGMVRLGLPPAVFWDLTPAELFLLAGVDGAPAALTRAGLDDLLARFPDVPTARNNNGER